MLVLSLDKRQEILHLSKEIQALEWRMDKIDFGELARPCPIILTCRSKRHGGAWTGSIDEQVSYIKKLLALKPEYIDLEYDLPKDLFIWVRRHHPEIKIIQSYHQSIFNLEQLHDIYQQMLNQPCDIIKLASLVTKSLEACLLLKFLIQAANKKLAVIPMGACGQFARIIAAKFANALNFCCLPNQQTASGQISIDDLNNIYRVDAETKLYGLLGHPITASIGHLFHNRYFREHDINAVYVKIDVGPEDFFTSLQHLHDLDFQGLSITMPLKLLAGRHKTSINTLKRKGHDWQACSTDGLAAYKLLQPYASSQTRILILGGGGAGQALAETLKEQGLETVIVRRDTIHSIRSKFDIYINTWPQLTYSGQKHLTDFLQQQIDNNSVCFDVVYQEITVFSMLAKAKAAVYIDGEHMFYHQAYAQQVFWQEESTISSLASSNVPI